MRALGNLNDYAQGAGLNKHTTCTRWLHMAWGYSRSLPTGKVQPGIKREQGSDCQGVFLGSSFLRTVYEP